MTDDQVNPVWSIHAKEYYSALKRKEVLTPAAPWMIPEDMMLSERRQTQKEESEL